MAAAPHLGVSPAAYKPDGVPQVQPRGISMVMSSDGSGVPYGMVPQLATLQIGSSVRIYAIHLPQNQYLQLESLF